MSSLSLVESNWKGERWADLFPLETQSQEEAEPVPTTPKGAHGPVRNRNELGWHYLIFSTVWRQADVSDVQTSLKRTQDSLLSQEAIYRQEFYELLKSRVLTSLAKFWFISCIELSPPA